MATIYRFIVEGGGTGGGNTKSGTGSAKTKHAKKFKTPNSNDRPTGVEFNRYQRITTTLGNKMTNGMYSPTLRTGKAVAGVVSGAGYGVPILAIMIIVQAILRRVEQYIVAFRDEATKENTADIRKMQTGQTIISKQYKTSINAITGRIKFNEND